ncbi:YaiI/YqxD family protein [Fundicoccus culcitae]|uniref:UPF0178 protein NRE15_13595 n=1 Tax=Fundicoccus culcitae TaxID=2969821 RepID=A0ABY5P673_9LACT|nr:YaiI/YqxD family protein [Fundicoccus culcitae]UUX33898.1 YaiI/YqxD family protein [Fundicoccus culcitae]
MKIYIDADGSPVKDEVIKLAKRYHLEVIMVTAFEHYTNKIYPDFVTFIYVDKGKDAVDFKIISLIEPNDILVTQDYGLASLLINKANVINQSGMVYTQDNIDQLLWQRHIGQQMRKQGLRTKSISKYSDENRQSFSQSLQRLIEDHLPSD